MGEHRELQKIENFINIDEKLDISDKNFARILFIYKMALKEIENKMEIIREEFKFLYEYDLIDHIATRIKSNESIMEKMHKKCINNTYKEMIKNINDIAGIRAICYLKDDIYVIRNLIANLPGIKIVKEKDYVKNPKKSGYSSYHMIIEVPVILSQKAIYAKVEIQIRTMAMDFWASIEHKMKYKTEREIKKSTSKELIKYAEVINKLDNKIMILNT